MPISPPIQGSDLETLPDDTDLVEELASRPDVETVLPKFVGDADTGRFVTSFFVVKGETMTVYARRRDGDTVDFEQVASGEVCEPVGWVGTVWNQTLQFAGDDVATVVDLRERAAYESHWLFAGRDPEESFEDYRLDPLAHEPTGFVECEHTPSGENDPVPNLGIDVSSCSQCDAPLFVMGGGEGTRSMEVLNAVHIGEAFGDDVIRGFRVVPDGPVSPKEEALYVLSHMANNENPSLPRYARGGKQALIFLVGDQIVGYATWQHTGPHVTLDGIYVLPDYRGEGGLAETVVQGFYDEVENDEYFVETPNEACERALARAGHLDTGVATPVATLACRDTTDASEPGAIYNDPRPRQFNPVQ
ncbi:GNAT family N-acetyltransferase [Halorubellus sp. JP-L1]|uniref:GNAT family N-acetyltransferase n=1 Tax=Halorubellus sp. JP-L1 TaxID=2715753 RepID=UPI001408B279|nr:GNAT family N-acetyltransferase [Halorubellus sp. JP-L1]NHN40398.1 GNAT family N-acetyltransferase [Halorubellus sp. JP-L1]